MAVMAVVVARMTSMATRAASFAYSCRPSVKQQIETVLFFTRYPEFRLCGRLVGWVGGLRVRMHPSAVLACRFRREATLPAGHCRDVPACQNDSAGQTDLTCWELQTLQSRNRMLLRSGLHMRHSDFRLD